jgi:hypothetical protein
VIKEIAQERRNGKYLLSENSWLKMISPRILFLLRLPGSQVEGGR